MTMRINEAVGDFLRQYRDCHGLTMDDVAAASRRYGSSWSAATVRDVERGGGKADSLPTILILASALNDLHEGVEDDCELHPVRVSDMIGTGYGLVDLKDGFEVPGWVVLDMLRDKGTTLTEHLTADAADVKDEEECGGTPAERLTRFLANHIPTATERRAAWRCGCDDAEVLALEAYALFGRPYDAEVKARAGEGATPQKRGRVARVLDDEIIDWMVRTSAEREGMDDDASTGGLVERIISLNPAGIRSSSSPHNG